MQNLFFHIVLFICLAGSTSEMKQHVALNWGMNNDGCNIEANDNPVDSNLGYMTNDEYGLSIGAQINSKVPSNLSSLASCALLTTVESNYWIHYSSAKSNHLFQGRFDGPFSFFQRAPEMTDYHNLKDKFSQGDLSHSTDLTKGTSGYMTNLDETYFCSQHSKATIFGRGVSFLENRVGNRSTDTCS